MKTGAEFRTRSQIFLYSLLRLQGYTPVHSLSKFFKRPFSRLEKLSWSWNREPIISFPAPAPASLWLSLITVNEGMESDESLGVFITYCTRVKSDKISRRCVSHEAS